MHSELFPHTSIASVVLIINDAFLFFNFFFKKDLCCVLQTLEDIINFCLKKTEELGLNSITFPAIGTGGFGFPKTIVSKLMFDVVFKFSSSHARKSLQEVHFLLSPKDLDNIQVVLLGAKPSVLHTVLVTP